jgi:hypothetical protein
MHSCTLPPAPLLAGMLYVLLALTLYVVLGITGQGHPDIALRFLLIGLCALIGSYLPYRLSLSGHVRNGELFKSLFDVDRVQLKDLTTGTDAERERWYKIWNELQHNVK